MSKDQAEKADEKVSQPLLQQAFPPPPAFYKLYGTSADGSEVPAPPPPPPPVEGEYQLFGELYTTEDGIPPLTVRQLFTVNAQGLLDFKGELRRLNKELLFTFLDLLDCLVQRPSAYARAVENVGLIARNMSYILNALRSEQARATLEHTVKVEIADRKEAIRELRESAESARALLRRMAEGIHDACKEAETEGRQQAMDEG
ncbi:MED7-domain-containing protein [Coccomyxa subellipsoidea C-169]|uniref:Mediator of RNA polymerase II transcription subunit 7 n=1 Tax=Coccomyxa subellipsoidea (strain C-169) TaxID=574566 RepID=I0YMA0_COCSC|nr:MED7-domain-containing protein [Coccomyxa subellipsoidea C-169]EIE19519.1 MED7-domain-containing protein [Coccomyxa subellipsoidea C-169]|eukprot:XP_005644063.1 MED7-domain-containing protein [Coccomyxa subellipsoidea C-169]